MTDRVRAVLITQDNQLLTIRRVRPGQEPYSVLPGGGAETGEDLNTALARELREEIAATADIHSLLLNLKPDLLAQFLISHITAGDDLFALPDLRDSRNTPPSSS